LIYTDPTGFVWDDIPEGHLENIINHRNLACDGSGGYYNGIGGYGGGYGYADGNGGGGYTYNSYLGNYQNSAGELVTFNEVNNNYIVPNASTNPQDIIDILSSLYPNNQPLQENNPSQTNNNSDPCGEDKWTLFPNRLQAELVINFNSTCNKEKYFYINTDGTVLLGPWKNNKWGEASGYLDRFLLGNVLFNGMLHKVEYFVHTHPDTPRPSTNKRGQHDSWATEFFNNYNITTLIYFNGNYYYYDDNTFGLFGF
jgi:hypothetical protein